MKNQLSSLQIDALQEIANIGGSNAATCLSQLVGSPVKIIAPTMSLVPISNYITEVALKNDQMTVVAKMDVMGGTPGNMLFFINYKGASHLVDLLLGRKKHDNNFDKEMDIVELQVIKQVSIILAASYLYALSKFLQMTIVPGDPIVRTLTMGEAIDHILTPMSQMLQNGFFIRNEFLESYSKIEGHLLFLPYQQALETILVIVNEKAGKGRR